MNERTAFIFPGQGSQYAGMGKKLYHDHQWIRELYEEAGDVLGTDMGHLLLEADIEELERSGAVQQAIVISSVCSCKALVEEYGILPDFLAGHSLGEISALACSGMISFADALRIVKKREALMNTGTAGLGAMVAVMGVEPEIVERACILLPEEAGYAAVSNYNSDDQVTLSGTRAAIDEVLRRLEAEGGRAMPIAVGGPFHSRLMEAAVPEMREELERYSFCSAAIPVVSSITGQPYQSEKDVVEWLSAQLVSPVCWTKVLSFLADRHVPDLIEVGPQAVLRNLSLTNRLGITVYAMENRNDLEEIVSRFSPIPIVEMADDHDRFRLLNDCLKEALCSPNLNWDKQEFEQGVIAPCRQAAALLKELERSGRPPGYREMKSGLDMLGTVLATKKMAKEDQDEIVREVLFANGLFECFHNYLAG